MEESNGKKERKERFMYKSDKDREKREIATIERQMLEIEK
jgi:hypothetical protein